MHSSHADKMCIWRPGNMSENRIEPLIVQLHSFTKYDKKLLAFVWLAHDAGP